MMKFLLCLLFVTAITALSLPFDLRMALKQKGSTEVWVVFKNSVDFKKYSLSKGVNFNKMEDSKRGKLVYSLLKDAHKKSQSQIISYLKRNNVEFHSHVIANAISLKKADFGLLENLKSQFNEIEKFELVEFIQLPKEDARHTTPLKRIEAGVAWVKAPEVWSQGHTGEGIVVGVIDTGTAIHRDLAHNYRGRDGNHAENWLDTTTTTRREPYDDHFHGTHCQGTVQAKNANDQVGVAPDADWISCKFLTRTGGGSLANAVRCFEFMLAPDGNTDARAHIVSNSWGGGSASAAMIRALDAMHAAGILNVFAAGNSGRGNRCSTVLNPALIDSSFAVGALNRNANTIADFSSRGPGRNNRVKPEISAPGVSVRSTSNIGNGYRTASGTSMACPHVAGVAALLWSAVPELKRNVDESRKVLQDTATFIPNNTNFCRSPSSRPNNFFGWGGVDAEAAVDAARESSLIKLIEKLN